MPTLAGKVATITGLVQVKDPITGAVTALKQGDKVYADDIIITSLDGNTTLNLTNGDLLTMGRDMQMALSEDVIGTAAISDSATEGAVDVEALQLAVLQGNFDALEATAAGGEPIPNSSANAGPLNTVDRLGLEGEVTSGFDTATAPVVLAEAPEAVFVEPAAVVVPPVVPTVVPPVEPLCDKEIVGTDAGDSFGFLYPPSFDVDFTFEPGDTICITNYSFSDDSLHLTDLILTNDVSGTDLDEYLQFNEVNIEGEDKTEITVDSNGESVSGGDVTTIYIDAQTGNNDYWKIIVDQSFTEYDGDY